MMEEAAEPDIEIEIEDPERVSIEMGGLEIEIEPGKEGDDFNANLAEEMDEDELVGLAGDLLGDFDEDISPPQRLDADICRWLRASWV